MRCLVRPPAAAARGQFHASPWRAHAAGARGAAENDRKAYYETSQWTIKQNRETLAAVKARCARCGAGTFWGLTLSRRAPPRRALLSHRRTPRSCARSSSSATARRARATRCVAVLTKALAARALRPERRGARAGGGRADAADQVRDGAAQATRRDVPAGQPQGNGAAGPRGQREGASVAAREPPRGAGLKARARAWPAGS